MKLQDQFRVIKSHNMPCYKWETNNVGFNLSASFTPHLQMSYEHVYRVKLELYTDWVISHEVKFPEQCGAFEEAKRRILEFMYRDILDEIDNVIVNISNNGLDKYDAIESLCKLKHKIRGDMV